MVLTNYEEKEVRKNSRASRRLETDEPEVTADVSSDDDRDTKSRVLQQIAERKIREGSSTEQNIPDDIEGQLTAISRGSYAGVNSGSSAMDLASRVRKNAKKNKRSKKKQERAELVKDMLSEKIQQAKTRNKKVRRYREEDSDES